MEIWKAVKDYEGLYEVSNLGNVKSLNYNKTKKEKVFNGFLEKTGYLTVCLSKKGKYKTRTIHQLVAESFLNHTPNGRNLVVNHKDFNRINNNIENLEIITVRENANQKHIKSTSEYTGVSWYKNNSKWVSTILIKRKKVFLGYYKTELEAHNAYQKVLKSL